jgi:hypothetical protein
LPEEWGGVGAEGSRGLAEDKGGCAALSDVRVRTCVKPLATSNPRARPGWVPATRVERGWSKNRRASADG